MSSNDPKLTGYKKPACIFLNKKNQKTLKWRNDKSTVYKKKLI